LLQHDPRFREPRIDEGRPDGAYPRRRHARVGKDEWEHSRAVIERARDDGRQVVGRRDEAQPATQGGKFTGAKQFVSTLSAG
jgi:hypothetical protein